VSSPISPLLLDTNILIWAISASDKISSRARRAMSRPAVSLTVSTVSVWELLIKHQAGKLRLHSGLGEVLDEILYRSPWTIMPVTSEHLPVLASLPTLHKDPFDRLLIAQAQHEGMTIVTADEQIAKYEVRTVW
jgi:PIN domain nuclease of toxin-antitoxin system